jgi:heptaprenyl diphosphate synthase
MRKLTPLPGSLGQAGNRNSWNPGALALLGSFCLFLSAIEYLIPKPLPFMRIGLANLPLLLALDLFPPGPFALLVLIKISGQALITGSLFSYVFVFSLAGSSAAALIMYSLRRLLGKNRIGFTGVSIAGAMLSNLIQLVLARLFVFGEGVRFLAPLFLISGLVSGAALGLFCEAFAARSRWFRRALGEDVTAPCPGEDTCAVAPGSGPPRRKRDARRLGRQERWSRLFRSGDLFIAGLFMMLVFLFTTSLVSKALQFLFFLALAFFSGRKIRPVLALLVMLGIVAGNLLVPYGKILAEWGPVQLTQGALLAGLRRALTLEGLVFLSGAFIRADLRLPGVFGAALGESFRLFAVLQNRNTNFDRKRVIEGIDGLMLELEQSGAAEPKAPPPGPRHPASAPLLAAMALACILMALAGPLTAF